MEKGKNDSSTQQQLKNEEKTENNDESLSFKGTNLAVDEKNNIKEQFNDEQNKELASERKEINENEEENNIQLSKDINKEEIKEIKIEQNSDENNNDNNTKKNKICQFIKDLCHELFIEGFGGMAQGLFCTLIVGTIVCQIGKWCKSDLYFGKMLYAFGSISKQLMGAGIGVGIANKFKVHPLIIFSSSVCGTIGAFAKNLVDTLIKNADFSWAYSAPGNPIGSFICTIISIKIANLYVGKTKLDIVLVPLGMVLICVASIFVSWPFIKLIDLIGQLIEKAIDQGTGLKYIVCIFVSIIMGIFLTLPTSSAAIWISIGASQNNSKSFLISSAAACSGGAAHMIGFAVSSFRENSWSGLISQGIGTSMLQVPNIMKKPIILIPQIISSIVLAVVSVVLDMRCNVEGGGMGTAGLVGLFGIIDASQNEIKVWKYVLGIILCLFVIPALVSLGVSELMRKKGWIKEGDMKLEY